MYNEKSNKNNNNAGWPPNEFGVWIKWREQHTKSKSL